MYLALIIPVKTYFTISLAFRERDGMDAGDAHWMTWSINRTHHPLGAQGFTLTVGDVGYIFLPQLMYIKVATLYLYLFHHFLCIRGGTNGSPSLVIWVVSACSCVTGSSVCPEYIEE
jgi:hypothetical protein